MFTEFKKVNDYQKQCPSGNNGYFQLNQIEKKDCGLPPKLIDDFFQSVITFVPRNRAMEPHPDQFVDSGIEDVRETQRSPPHVLNPDFTANIEENDIEHTGGSPDVNAHHNAASSDGFPHHVPPVSPTHINASEGLQRQCSGSVNVPHSAKKTTRGWKRTRGERTTSELRKITQSFVTAIAEDRVARREEHLQWVTLEEKKHTEILTVQKEAQQSARETGKDIANALAFIGDSIRYLADGVRDCDRRHQSSRD